jgi:malate synthase
MAKVRADKQREAGDGHDGTWVAHPALVPLARSEFEAVLGDAPNQVERLREDVVVEARDLLTVPTGERTEAGLRQNLSVGVQYLEAWLRGIGCVPLYDLMEDAATAEISRAQVWQQVHHRARLADGRAVDASLVRTVLAEELAALRAALGPDRYDGGRFALARTIFERLVTGPELAEFLTLEAYPEL